MLNNLTLFATTRCGLKCAHCLRGYPTSHDDFPLDLLPNLLDEGRLFGAQHVGLTGGEPCLHPQFERLTDIILEADFKLSFISNRQDVKPYLAVFERYPGQVTSVALSLDDADPAGHDRNRGKPGAFEAVMASAHPGLCRVSGVFQSAGAQPGRSGSGASPGKGNRSLSYSVWGVSSLQNGTARWC